MICIHGLTPPQRGNLGRYFGTIRAMPAILLRCYYFWNFSLGCPAVPIWEHSMENLEIKKIGKTFSQNFFWVIYSSHLTVQCLFRLFIYQMRFLSRDLKVPCNFPKFQVFHFHFHWEDTSIGKSVY